MSPGPDPTHWLFRLTAEEWLAAAEKELALSFASLRGKHRREGLTYARRAAGMALNAWLVGLPDETYGRSYMDHLKALRADERAPEAARTAAAALLEAPMQTNIVPLGPGTTELAEAAERIVAVARARATSRPA